MLKSNKGFSVIELLVGVLIAVGWVMNIITLFGSSFAPLTVEVVSRVVGVFIAPLGAVLGYL